MPSDDAIRVRDLELRFQGGLSRPPPGTDDVIYMFKDMAFVARLNSVLQQIAPRRMIEIGVLHGGGTIYWQSKYELERLSAFDIAPDAAALTRYLERNGLTDAVRVHFGVPQDDRDALRG